MSNLRLAAKTFAVALGILVAGFIVAVLILIVHGDCGYGPEAAKQRCVEEGHSIFWWTMAVSALASLLVAFRMWRGR